MERGVIVSVTSFPARIPYIAPALESILRQKGPEDRVVLWLGEEQFPNGLADVPENIRKLSTGGGERLEIRFVRDTRSFKKLLPALDAFPENAIITLDDDNLYPDGVISKLKEAAQRMPGAILSHCASDLYRVNGSWRRTTGNIGFAIGCPFLQMQTGGGGVYYPPHSLDPLVMNADLAMKLCPTSDDIWFWFCAVRQGTPVARIANGITRHKGIAAAAGKGALSAINEIDDDRINLQHLRNLLDFDPEVEQMLLTVYKKNRFKILVLRGVRVLVRYPQQAIFCLRTGGWRFLFAEAKRKFRHFRIMMNM